MSNFKNVGTFDAGVFTPKMSGAPQGGVPTMDAAGIASGGAFLVSELEKRDPLIRKPLTMLACDNSVDIHAGDELIIHRGGRLGKSLFDTRAFAGDPHYYFEPFGAVIPGLAHQEIIILQEERVSQ